MNESSLQLAFFLKKESSKVVSKIQMVHFCHAQLNSFSGVVFLQDKNPVNKSGFSRQLQILSI